MKTLYLIGGPMGVGKTAVCQRLKARLDRSVFLDGDWCWDMHPFQVTDETKALVMRNISFLLSGFLRCDAFEHVIFAWVMHEQAIVDEILARVDASGCAVRAISLTCDGETLCRRLQKDIDAGLREPDVIARSLSYLPRYAALRTEKLDVSALSPGEAAERIAGGGEL